MLSSLDSAILERAVEDSIQIMGVQPRTGYLCGPLARGSNRVEGFVTYVRDHVVPWVNKMRSLREARALLPSICGNAD